MFTLHVANRDYTDWHFVNKTDQGNHLPATTLPATLPEAFTSLAISPLSEKLFHGDCLDEKGKLISAISRYRTKKDICGVLLTSEKSYGRENNKLLYKCVPDDEHLPCFLVPYQEKNIGFSKIKTDKYISFEIKEWISKHPIGTITNTFGVVDDIEAYIAYRIAAKEIGDSIKTLNAASIRTLRETTLGPIPYYYENTHIEDRRSSVYNIIAIDPAGCTDIDDAISIQKIPNEDSFVLSIYIANVPMMLEYLNLWPYLTTRVSTIYLPDKKMPMLPIVLSDNVCSLRQKEDRLAFVMDIHINDNSIQSINYGNVIINVNENYVYESPKLIATDYYKSIKNVISELNSNPDCKYLPTIQSSHEIIEYCMILMNRESAKILKRKKSGIFRSAVKKEAISDNNNIPSKLKMILQNVSGEYCLYDNLKPHELIAGGLDSYLHITSPIRRIVDIVNMMELLKDKFKWSKEAILFMKQKTNSIAEINAKSKAIRKLQNEIELLSEYNNNKETFYTGIVFNQTIKNDTIKNDTLFKYMVYIPKNKMLTTVLSSKNIKNYTSVAFSAHLFLDEAKMTKKIRLQML